MHRRLQALCATTLFALTLPVLAVHAQGGIGREVAVPIHLQDGDEHHISRFELLEHGELLFGAMFTPQEGGGRPFTTGTGNPLADPDSPLLFPRNFNRISAPDANSCAGCHNLPRPGGGGDIVANVFVLGQRFDHLTFDLDDPTSLRGARDERGDLVTLQQAANSRATLGMFGSGYIEMLARQMTADLQRIRDSIAPGQQATLTSKGVSFGVLARNGDGSWDTSGVEGLSVKSLASDAATPPNLIIRPFHQAGAVISLREFTNNALNHHHGIQSSERFGDGVDADGDGFVDEATRADVTAMTLWQATLEVPGRMIPSYRPIEEAVLLGEELFAEIGCETCHVSALPLDNYGWEFVEPNPYNPTGNLQPGETDPVVVNLNSKGLPQPRLRAVDGVTWVPAFTDLKLHDITSGPDDPNREPLDMHAAGGSDEFFAGNGRFLTKKLWGVGNEPPYYHHGQYATMRQAILAHAGEAQGTTDAFLSLTEYEQGSIIEFLKSLQLLPAGTKALAIDDRGRPRQWPPN